MASARDGRELERRLADHGRHVAKVADRDDPSVVERHWDDRGLRKDADPYRAFRAAKDVFSATAARMSACNAFASILSPSWKSMARLVLPSRLELKRPEGSFNEAPLAKVN